jgi:hypothetical protein
MADKTQKPLSETIKQTQINYTTWCRDSQMQETLREKNMPLAHKGNIKQTVHKVRGL